MNIDIFGERIFWSAGDLRQKSAHGVKLDGPVTTAAVMNRPNVPTAEGFYPAVGVKLTFVPS